MAVKSRILLEIIDIRFLSRLCGGEGSLYPIVTPYFFLSRLCGGEGLNRQLICAQCFLSRLCGGEV